MMSEAEEYLLYIISMYNQGRIKEIAKKSK